MTRGQATFRVGEAEAVVDADDGCRLVSLRVGGHELLVTRGRRPWWYGGFVMAPWAGRLRGGVARHDGRERRFPVLGDGHSSHGLVHSTAWESDGEGRWHTTVSADEWLGALTLRQAVRLRPDGLLLELSAEATEAEVPVTLGWHPWFRREVAGRSVEVGLPSESILAKDDAGIQTSERVPAGDGPYNDAFVGHDGAAVIRWPGVLDLRLRSDAPVLLVYDADPAGVCVEPQTGPPDEVNGASPRTTRPGEPVSLRVEIGWDSSSGEGPVR
ncbi:aldose 1-epimerase [Aeromicrobium piscarium]|uniref:Aldose 1-epimerase n=1 Tax=Aeromicrobium piscarium TaxID=2590901 RepID=A0A554RWD1_9ACTN|nr:hypothetical protein [Aeromicrobium piscarium]TSD58408.1 hypothetical protein FNM00_14510 [Aeromicrobium piscarium]